MTVVTTKGDIACRIASDHRPQPTRTSPNLGHTRDGTDRARIPCVVPTARERVLDRSVVGVDRCQRSGTHVELSMQVVRDLDRISRVLVRRREHVLGLRRHRSRGLQVEQLLGERCRGRVVLGLDKCRHRQTQREQEMCRLQSAVREVGGQFELPLRALRRGAELLDASSLDLERKTDKIFAADDNKFLQLRRLAWC
ncbi:BZ3500_MvSof-1268-A1-R1_Chr3-1g05962 [Microbotryum saponariae]|uniref:BZ3500_MvSof-1268-A1-R1_Chr3-1g05962 protein n=1 Tax=Microbotryum saponariae TaxID=289078 RepID=A0A2X0KYU2_9BASI|nr:BZ3500_MvSof-1268-A1-R1_Chr3-1g05962 [Microbotryum saponariae]SDA05152.1 BZ3501_MvSof-1269-A2-R1_Chr3-1g05632 [Microbotryum saponariae]